MSGPVILPIDGYQHPLMQRLWIEFMRAPFNGQPLWCWYADKLDAREKKAFYEAFCGLSTIIDNHVSRETAGLSAHLAAEQAHRERMLRDGIVLGSEG